MKNHRPQSSAPLLKFVVRRQHAGYTGTCRQLIRINAIVFHEPSDRELNHCLHRNALECAHNQNTVCRSGYSSRIIPAPQSAVPNLKTELCYDRSPEQGGQIHPPLLLRHYAYPLAAPRVKNFWLYLLSTLPFPAFFNILHAAVYAFA